MCVCVLVHFIKSTIRWLLRGTPLLVPPVTQPQVPIKLNESLGLVASSHSSIYPINLFWLRHWVMYLVFQ